MLKTSIKKWLTVAALLGCGLAMAAEPTLNEIYEAAHAERMEQAQVMMQQVLVAHPNSGKAHFVQAELSAGQGQLSRAREELATAEKLAPGLPFAKPEAVQKLRALLAGKGGAGNVAAITGGGGGNSSPAPSFSGGALPAQSAPAAPSVPMGLILALGGGAIAIVIWLIRRKPAAPAYAPSAYSSSPAGGLSGPQSFGMGGAVAPAGYGQGYNQGYGPGYGQPAQGSGLGGRIAGGLATGLAVGAGVVAAEAIGRSIMGGHEDRSGSSGSSSSNYSTNGGYEPIADRGDMGGQNFGVNDGGSWDDGGGSVASSDDGGGGDWDT